MLTSICVPGKAPLLAYLNHIQKPYWIRQVILKGINDGVESVMQLEALTLGKTREKLEVLPYHEMGAHKWKANQLHDKGHFEVPDADSMRSLNKWIEINNYGSV